MGRPDYQKQIENRIVSVPMGAVFITSDFLDLADTQTVNKALSRLAADGTIRRVIRGVYDRPGFSTLLQEYSDAERGIGLRPGFVPSATFWIMLGEKVIGVSNIRRHLNSALLLYGGHLGLCIRPSERGKGLARAVLPALFHTARDLGIGMLMTSTTADNAASIRLCESMPFFHRETDTVPLNGAPRRILRYWHELG